MSKVWYFLFVTGDQIRKRFQAAPFVPFRVNMANGKSVDVPHPDFMYLTPTSRTLIVTNPDDTVEIIDVLLVTSLLTLPKNGSRRSKRNRRKRG